MNRKQIVSLPLWIALMALAGGLSCSAEPSFDYFKNSWSMVGLKDYGDATRITPANELQIASNTRLQICLGSRGVPLGTNQTKTLLEGWLPIVLLNDQQDDMRYEFAIWATPLPAAKNWKASYDYPCEGENFLNWVRVQALNTGKAPAQARVRVQRFGVHAAPPSEWICALEPGQRAETCFRIPYSPTTGLDAFERADPKVWLDRTCDYWRGLLARGAQIQVPSDKASQAFRAALVCQFITSDHGVPHGGEGFYDEFFIRDGAYQLLHYEEAGYRHAAARVIDAILAAQKEDGRFESQPNQLDANGQALWALWQFWKITGDTHWLAEVYPAMLRSAEWVKAARHLAAADSPFAGLMPNAVADGEYLWDGKHHIVGYDLWNLRGLLCVLNAAEALGKSADARTLRTESDAYRAAIDAAWKRSGLAYFPPSWEKAGTHWGNLELLWPTELFPPEDSRVEATLTEVRQHHAGGFVEGAIRWTGFTNAAIHPYLSAYATMASMVRGENEQFVHEFWWYLLHSSATHAFPEGVFYKDRIAWADTIPHALGAANYAFLLRHSLIHERADELHLLPGCSDSWLAPGGQIVAENLPSRFGNLSLRIRSTPKGIEVHLDPPSRKSPKSIILHLPESRRSIKTPANITVRYRPPQTRTWDFTAIVKEYESAHAESRKP